MTTVVLYVLVLLALDSETELVGVGVWLLGDRYGLEEVLLTCVCIGVDDDSLMTVFTVDVDLTILLEEEDFGVE